MTREQKLAREEAVRDLIAEALEIASGARPNGASKEVVDRLLRLGFTTSQIAQICLAIGDTISQLGVQFRAREDEITVRDVVQAYESHLLRIIDEVEET